MRYREPFTVFPREIKNKEKNTSKIVYYYQCRLPDGSRTNPRSTGKDSEGKAKQWCLDQFKAGKLPPPQPEPTETPTLRMYSESWYLYDSCPYIRAKLKRGGSFSRTRAKAMRVWLTKKVWPVFGALPLDKITPKMIESWMFDLKDEKTKIRTERSAASVNHVYAALRVLLNEAERLGDIAVSPCRRVKPLADSEERKREREKGILSHEEREKLFKAETVESVWEGQLLHHTLNLFACATGLRQGECLGLRWENVFEDHVHVCHSFEKQLRELKSTKTGQVRDVPISSKLHAKLLEMKLKYGNRGGYVFSLDEGQTPIFDSTVRKWYGRALSNIGITEDQRKARNLCFHSWRHGLNSRLVEAELSGELIREILGHSTVSMTAHYSHVDTAQVVKLKEIIEEIS